MRRSEFSPRPQSAATLGIFLCAGCAAAVLHWAPARAADPVVEEEPLPVKSPSRFNPDPGGGRNPGSQPTLNAPADAPIPSLFGTGAPALAAPQPYGREPLPRGLRLPREHLEPSDPLVLRLDYPTYQYSPGGVGLLPNAIPETNRWQIPFGRFQRYSDGSIETPYKNGLQLFDPYKQSLLKGDAPIIGQDIFLNLIAQDQFLMEFRRLPVGSGVSAAQAGSTDFYGRGDSLSLSNTLSFTIELFKGETAFKPIDWDLRLTPVFNINYAEFKEVGVLDPDPRGPNYTGNGDHLPVAIAGGLPGGTITNPGDVTTFFNTPGSGLKLSPVDDFAGTHRTRRTDTFATLQEGFFEVHLKDISDNYDFLSARVGNQLLNSDFRGFIFNDTNSGVRLFGNYDNNKLQYNLAYFNMREKDTNSGLNTFDARAQDVIIFNVFRQDFLNLFLPASNPYAQGYTAEFNMVANLDHGGLHYDRNGFLVRPAPIGQVEAHDVNVVYLGLNGDGHIGPFNLTNAFYQVLGRDEFNGIAGHPVNVNAQMAAFELSMDHDYIRPKASFLYASGNGHAHGGTATGFDSVQDSPTFIGNPFSFFAHQGFALGNTAVLTKTPDSLLIDLRTSKGEGQANFDNPGTLIGGLGLDVDVTPKIRAQFNANYIRMVNPDPVKVALFTNRVNRELGYDISLGFTYRPTLTSNIIINAGFGAFITGKGYRDIYSDLTTPVPGFTTQPAGQVDSVLYNAIVAVTLTY